MGNVFGANDATSFGNQTDDDVGNGSGTSHEEDRETCITMNSICTRSLVNLTDTFSVAINSSASKINNYKNL